MHDVFEEWKLFCPTPTMKYCGPTIKMEVFGPLKDMFLNDQLDVMVFDQGDLTMHTVNNITKKRVS